MACSCPIRLEPVGAAPGWRSQRRQGDGRTGEVRTARGGGRASRNVPWTHDPPNEGHCDAVPDQRAAHRPGVALNTGWVVPPSP